MTSVLAFPRPNRTFPAPSILLVAALLAASGVPAQEVVLDKESYLEPPAPIASVITSEAMHGQVSLRNLGPGGEHFLVNVSGGMVPLEKLARPHVNLGETALDHHADRSRRLTLENDTGLRFVLAENGVSRDVDLPAGITVSSPAWSPDGGHVAFVGNDEDASYLWVANVETSEARRVTDTPLLATMVTSVEWTWDGERLLGVFVPDERGPMPERDPVAGTPRVWVNQEGKTPTRTYRFLLQGPHDKELLRYLITGQLGLVDVETGELTPIGEPAMFTRVDAGPDGKFFRVTHIQEPFSYFVPVRSFGTREEIWNAAGEAVQLLQERKLREARDDDDDDDEQDAEPDRRSLTWRPDGQGLSFLQKEPKPEPKEAKKDDKPDAGAQGGKTPDKPADTPRRGARHTGGRRPTADQPRDPRTGTQDPAKADPKAAASASGQDEAKKPEKPKDRVMQWLPPYGDDDAKVVWESDSDIQGVQYSQDCKTLFVTLQEDRKRRLYVVDLGKPDEKVLLHEFEQQERGGSRRFRGRFGGGPRLMTRRGDKGGAVVRMSSDGHSVWMQGTEDPKDKDKESPRDWIERVSLEDGAKERVWQAAEGAVLENLLTPLDDDMHRLVVSRESRTDVPDSFLIDREGGAERQLTRNEDPAPEVTAARRERIRVKRVDGIEFWVDVTIPRYYGNRLPAMFWFYPREYTSQKAYDDSVRHDPNRFPMVRTRSMELLTLLGYVVVEPDCPIIGEQGRMNDNYAMDLRNNLWAVIDELDKREIIDRDRLGIGGHSYGAFGTANAMIHTPFFKAGIAGDGNYNRTLTPMSFQSERRHLWDARETYISMSPLLWANQLQGALLMYHGMDDSNTGTFPINSPRMFQALNGLDRTVALYMYPYEGHGPLARETILDLWARWTQWLDIHVKDPSRKDDLHKKTPPGDITEDK